MMRLARSLKKLPSLNSCEFLVPCNKRRTRLVTQLHVSVQDSVADGCWKSSRSKKTVSWLNYNNNNDSGWSNSEMNRPSRRYLSISSSPPDGSKPNPKASANNQSTLLVANESNQTSHNNNVLLAVAKEAERLLSQSVRNKMTKRSDFRKSTDRDNNDANDMEKAIEHEIAVALIAADTLLAASHPSSILADAILNNNSGKVHTASIHQAFLTLTTQCLNCIDSMHGTDDLVKRKHVMNLVERALELSRSAHELSLPFHLPLHQRLIDTVSRLYDPSRSLSKTILEISSWISSSSLNVSVDANLFSKAILTLLRNFEFVHAAELIVGIRAQHNACVVNVSNATAILLQLKDSVKELIERSPGGIGRRYVPDRAIADIVSLLENSIKVLTKEQKMKFDIAVAALQDEETVKMIRSLQKDEVYDLVLGMMAFEEQEKDEDDGSSSSTEDDDDNSKPLDLDEFDFNETDDDTTDHRHSMHDIIAFALDNPIHEILLKTIKDRKTKEMLHSVLKNATMTSTSTGESNKIPSTIDIPTNRRGTQVISTDYRNSINGKIAEESSFGRWREHDELSEEDDEDEEDEDDDDDDDDDIVVRYNLPDITDQLEQLNEGIQIKFTKKYREILWERDYEEKKSFYDSILDDDDDISDLDDFDSDTDFSETDTDNDDDGNNSF